MENDDYRSTLMLLCEVMLIAGAGYLAHKMAIMENDDKTLDELNDDLREADHKVEVAHERLAKAQERERLCDLRLRKIMKKTEASTSETAKTD
uniref:Phage protein n=1 Tax=Panagrellus redivivus TaxID=6233 RepID=A0A7E4ZY58_PANRE